MADLLNHLSRFSQEMQRRTGILIEQADLIDDLLKVLEKSTSYEEGNIIDLLNKAQCSKSDQERGCTLLEFEDSETVSLFGHELTVRARSLYSPLKDVRNPITAALIKEIKSYLPLEQMQPFSILDPKKIPEKNSDRVFFGTQEISVLARLYGQSTMNLHNSWKNLLEDLTTSDEWCSMKGSSVKEFWQHYLSSPHLEMSTELRNIIRSILVTPISSADAERGFSILFHTRSSRRSRLTAEHLEGNLRIRINGPKSIAQFPALKYAKLWQRQGKLLTDDKLGAQFEPPVDVADEDPEGTASKKYLDGSTLF